MLLKVTFFLDETLIFYKGSSGEGASGFLEQGHIYTEINICVIMSSQKFFF